MSSEIVYYKLQPILQGTMRLLGAQWPVMRNFFVLNMLNYSEAYFSKRDWN